MRERPIFFSTKPAKGLHTAKIEIIIEFGKYRSVIFMTFCNACSVKVCNRAYFYESVSRILDLWEIIKYLCNVTLNTKMIWTKFHLLFQTKA